jgi:integrase
VAIPEVLIPVVRWHLSCFAQKDAEGLVFTSPRGKPMWNSQFRGRVWLPALSEAGLMGMHFHDLRHSGNTLAASAGASIRDLMDCLGHDSERAAMIYLHGSDERQHAIADTLSKFIQDELKRPATGRNGASGKRSGTQRAHKSRRAAR